VVPTTVASKLVVLFAQINEEEHHDGRRSEDDGCGCRRAGARWASGGRELMEAEVSEQVGARRGEVAPEGRVTHRNGYRSRPWETRVGEIDFDPPDAAGQLFPQFLGAAAAV
jgi:hypothetical protein